MYSTLGQLRGMKKLRMNLREELNIILKKEELTWFQRSKAKWLADDDRNTKYYHLKTITKRRKNKISMLKDENDKYVEDDDQLKSMINEYYKKLFTISGPWNTRR